MNKIEKTNIDKFKHYIMCDQLAVGAAIYPDLITRSYDVYATVELGGLHTRGALIIDYLDRSQKPPNVTIIEDMDKEKFTQVMLNTFS